MNILYHNTKNTQNLYSSTISFEINRLITIDTISVDDQSRFTFTRKLKKVLPILPNDTITIYQDRYNKDLIFAIQHAESNTTDSFIIKNKSNSSSTSTFYKTKTIEKKNQQEEENISNQQQQQIIKKKDTLYDINILLIDDHEDILETFEFFLKSEGYHNIQSFSDSKKVIKHFVQLKETDYYELAIIDIRMPIINGIQLYQILTILNPNMRVLFLTGLDAIFELTSILKIKEEDIIKKPCEFKQFIKKINDTVIKLSESK